MSKIVEINLEDDDDDEFYDSESEPTNFEEARTNLSYHDSPFPVNRNQSRLLLNSNGTPNVLTPSSMGTPNSKNGTIFAVKFLNNSSLKSSSNDLVSQSETVNRLFINAESAKNLCKKDPDNRRFKPFKNFVDAYNFSYDTNEIDSGRVPSMDQLKASLSINSDAALCNSSKIFSPSLQTDQPASPNLTSNLQKTAQSVQDAEKLPFSAPKKSEINFLRSVAEKSNLEGFKEKVLSNPRYLISSGETPVIFQEAFRYNILHVCAKGNNHKISELVINLLSSTSFLQKLYRNDVIDQTIARCNHLLDLYLNTPEKGLSETPLHFACKFGSYEVARQFISLDLCNKNALNKNNQTPYDIICSKVESKANLERIKNLFENCVYVQVYRNEDKGEVVVNQPSSKLSTYLNPKDDERLSSKFNNSSSQNRLIGYLGPTSQSIANEIYERIKTPSKLRQSPKNRDLLRGDELKGFERITRKLTEELNIPWCEYWSFLDCYCNLKQQTGLEKLEIYLRQKKLQIILNFQIKSVQNMMNDKLNNNNILANGGGSYFNDNNLKLKADHPLIGKLEMFLSLVEQLKQNLDIKENILSTKFESFTKIMFDKKDSCELPVSFSNSDSIDIDNTVAVQSPEFIINDILTKYFSIVIELSNLDKKCYFYLYKTSKILLELINCNNLFQNFYLSPIFKRMITSNFCKTTASSSNNHLTNNINITNQKFELRDTLSRRISFDEEDEDNDVKLSDDEEDKQSPIKSKMKDAKDTFSDLDNVELWLSSMKLNDDDKNLNEENTQKTNKASNHLKNSNNENLTNGKPQSNMNIKTNQPNFDYIEQNETNFLNKIKQLYIIGDNPSKIDRSVYIAIQEVKVDELKFPLLSEWFNYMKRVSNNEMQQWKTPLKFNIMPVRFKV